MALSLRPNQLDGNENYRYSAKKAIGLAMFRFLPVITDAADRLLAPHPEYRAAIGVALPGTFFAPDELAPGLPFAAVAAATVLIVVAIAHAPCIPVLREANGYLWREHRPWKKPGRASSRRRNHL